MAPFRRHQEDPYDLEDNLPDSTPLEIPIGLRDMRPRNRVPQAGEGTEERPLFGPGTSWAIPRFNYFPVPVLTNQVRSLDRIVEYLMSDDPGPTPRTENMDYNIALMANRERPYEFVDDANIPAIHSLFIHPASGIIDSSEDLSKIIIFDYADHMMDKEWIEGIENHPATFYHIYTYNPIIPYYGERGMSLIQQFESFELKKYSFLAKIKYNFIPDLPETLKAIIFKKLDSQTTFEFCNTCMVWYNLILDDYDSRVKLLRYQVSKRFYKIVNVQEDGTIEVVNRMVQYCNHLRYVKFPEFL